jgi:hypothetical protein
MKPELKIVGARKPLSKMVRFEVFKRDKFTCQYCGTKAPDVVLHADHIKPVAEGGEDELLNLVTACQACNGGKGARLLSDDSVVEKQRQQIEELEERRQQLEMILAWRDELAAHIEDVVSVVAERIGRRGFTPNDAGLADIRRWLKTYSVEEVLLAADEAFDAYLRFGTDDKVTADSWNLAFNKIANLASIRRQAVDKPYLKRLFYIQGILRKRCRVRRMDCINALEGFVLDGLTVEEMEGLAKRCDTWTEFDERAEKILAAKE